MREPDASGDLTGNLAAFTFGYDFGDFLNQGSPKPDGTLPAPGTPVSGTYNATTGAYTLTWASGFDGSSLNGSTGQWFLTGTYIPSEFQILNLALPGATEGAPYTDQLTAGGGVTPYKWKASGLPAGLLLGATTGQITGQVASTVAPGNYTVSVSAKEVSYPKLTATATYILTVTG